MRLCLPTWQYKSQRGIAMSLLCSVECGCVSSDGVRGVRASAVAEQLLVSRESGQVQVLNVSILINGVHY